MTNDIQADEAEIAEMLARFYAAVSGPVGVGLRAELEQDLFHPEARLARTIYPDPPGFPDGAAQLDVYSQPAFQEQSSAILKEIDFYEVGTSHDIFVYANIAHVISRYDAYADPDGETLLKRGINSIQMARTREGWRIYSVFWDDEINALAARMASAG